MLYRILMSSFFEILYWSVDRKFAIKLGPLYISNSDDSSYCDAVIKLSLYSFWIKRTEYPLLKLLLGNTIVKNEKDNRDVTYAETLYNLQITYSYDTFDRKWFNWIKSPCVGTVRIYDVLKHEMINTA